jgi:hypothetical protein
MTQVDSETRRSFSPSSSSPLSLQHQHQYTMSSSPYPDPPPTYTTAAQQQQQQDHLSVPSASSSTSAPGHRRTSSNASSDYTASSGGEQGGGDSVIPVEIRQQMEDEARPLPQGWRREFDVRSDCLCTLSEWCFRLTGTQRQNERNLTISPFSRRFYSRTRSATSTSTRTLSRRARSGFILSKCVSLPYFPVHFSTFSVLRSFSRIPLSHVLSVY